MEKNELFNPLILNKTHTKSIDTRKKSIIGYVLLTLLFSGVLFGTGVYIGYAQKPTVEKVKNVINQTTNKTPQDVANFDEFWKIWKLLDEKYPDAKNISNQDRMFGAIQGLVASMKDPYTAYFPPVESKIFNDEVTGSFSGIGVEVGIKEGLLVVISPLKKSPAELAGVKAGDIIAKVDGKIVAELSVDQAIKHIRGEKGSKVVLTLVRKDAPAPIEITVTRDTINIPTIDENKSGDTYMISLYNFNASAKDLFHKALLNAKQSNSKHIIIDLRGNPGGYLTAAIDIVSEFLPEGAVVVSEDFGPTKTKTVNRSKGYNTIANDVKISVLLDQGSASASEIVAGALQDSKRATIFGEKSFGKGSVQELIPVSKETSVKITVANWLTPNGSTISKKGITPDILVEQKDSKKSSFEDKTVMRALEYFTTGK